MTETTQHFDFHPILASRFSPRAYSLVATLGPDELGPLFEAARWSPSSSNSQPWSFVVGLRGDGVFQTILGTLASGNALWAQHASALVANITMMTTAEGKSLSHSVYDLGQAVAHLSAQATADNIVVHQMGGFDADALGAALNLGSSHRVITVMTLGTHGDPADLPENLREREAAPRVRKPLGDVVSGSISYD